MSGQEIYSASFTGSQALTTTFASMTLTGTKLVPNAYWLGTLWIFVNTIASSASSLTFRITRDSAGDECIIPDTTVSFTTGKTTAADGTVIACINVPAFTSTQTLYLFAKTDTGTCTCSEAQLTLHS